MNKQTKKQQKHQKELRTTLQGSRLEVREQNGSKTLAGYAVVFNSPADIGGSFIEYIAPGSFTRTLKDDDQVMLRDHRSELLLGRKSAGTLKLWQDSTGVAFQVTMPDTTLGQDTFENVRLGNLKGCSFSMVVLDDEWSQDASGNLTRTVNDLRCAEVTLTAFPAYEATSVDIRSIRAKLKRDSNDDGTCDPDSPYDDADNDDAEKRRECTCDCDACEDGNCDECSDPFCDSEDCDECPMQTRSAHAELLIRRLRS